MLFIDMVYIPTNLSYKFSVVHRGKPSGVRKKLHSIAALPIMISQVLKKLAMDAVRQVKNGMA
jgi:hypothetical protein